MAHEETQSWINKYEHEKSNFEIFKHKLRTTQDEVRIYQKQMEVFIAVKADLEYKLTK